MNDTTLMGQACSYQNELLRQAEEAHLALQAERSQPILGRWIGAIGDRLIAWGLSLQAYAERRSTASLTAAGI